MYLLNVCYIQCEKFNRKCVMECKFVVVVVHTMCSMTTDMFLYLYGTESLKLCDENNKWEGG